MKHLVFILIAYSALICSCHREVREQTIVNTNPKIDSSSISIKTEEDSINNVILRGILSDAIDTIRKADNSKSYLIQYEPINDYNTVKVSISNDFHFNKTNKHIIIRRQDPMNLYIDIYKSQGKYSKALLSLEQWGMTYVGDTIFDVNGDGYYDFVVNWYGSTGCCLKGFSDVYLSNSTTTAFSKCFTFINPTFSPNEHIIRGICYGHPGDTEMYKYKWNGEKIDTLEYVMFEKDTTGRNIGVIVSRQRNKEPDNIIKKQKHIPTEYKSINDFDWFIGNL